MRALLRRSALHPGEVETLRSGNLTVDLMAGRVELDGEVLALTAAEYRLLCLFLRHKGQILSRTAILDAMWDSRGSYVDDNTLSVYIRRLREKTEKTPSRPERLLTVRGMGYRWEDV